MLFYEATASRCIKVIGSPTRPLCTFTQCSKGLHVKKLLHNKTKSGHTSPERIPRVFSPRCPFPFTFGKCSSNIVRVLSCMLILWPWQRADHIAESREGSEGRVCVCGGGCSGQMLMTCSNAHLKPLARTRPLIQKEKQSAASSRGGTHKCLHGAAQQPQQWSVIAAHQLRLFARL